MAATSTRVGRRTILVVGDSFCDVNAGPLNTLPQWGVNVVSPAPILAHPGGAALNVASWLQRLRGDTALFSGIGRDAFGDLLRSHCSKLGVRLIEATSDASRPTGVCIVLAGPEDRAFCSHFGVADTFDASELLDRDGHALRTLQPRLGHIHCAGFYSCGALRKTLPALLKAARELGVTTSLDTNNDASGQWGAVDGLWDTLLPLLDLFVPNELEACAIAGVQAGDIDGAIAALSKQVGGCVVVTRGAKGAVIAGRSMDTRSVSAPVVEAIDAVGAGDAFKAGLLACFVSGTPLHEAAAYGAVTGSMNVTRRGACVDPPRPSEVAAFAAAHGVAPEVVAALQVQQEVASAPPSPPPPESPPAFDAGGADPGINAEVLGTTHKPEAPLWWAFALLWLGGTWPYQATLQAQAYYESELPDLSSLILITFTWPLLCCHVINVLSGAAKAAGFSRRIYAAFILNALVGVAFLAQEAVPLAPNSRRAIMAILAALVAIAQLLLEPALFGLAATLQGGGATQAMMVGNAAAGVVVLGASVLTRLAAGGGNPSKEQLGFAANVFYALQVAYSLASIGLYLLLLRRYPRLATIAQTGSRNQWCSAATPLLLPDGLPRSEGAVSQGLRERLVALRVAARAVWRPAACQALCFGVTLASWPSIPGAACVEGAFAGMGEGWWFTLVVGVYNCLDFAARVHLRSLQKVAATVSPRACLGWCLARIALVPLVYICVKPRLVTGAAGNVMILVLTAVLALSNGLLATSSMMQVASLAPQGLGEEGVYVAVAGVYLGLAAGASVSWWMGNEVMQLSGLACE